MTFLRFKESVDVIPIKNGELILLDSSNGRWVKTSISFNSICKFLRKGINEEKLLLKIIKNSKKRYSEVISVLGVIKENNLFENCIKEDKIFKELPSIDELKHRFILVKFPIAEDIFRNFCTQLLPGLRDYNKSIIFDIDKKEDMDTHIDLLCSLVLITKKHSIDVQLRLDYKEINPSYIAKLVNLPLDKIQITLGVLSGKENRSEESIQLLSTLMKKNIEVEIRYRIVTFFRKKYKKQHVLEPLVRIPHSNSYFVYDEMFKDGTDVGRYLKHLPQATQEFLDEAKPLIEQKYNFQIFIENFFETAALFPIKRHSCGAGITNFYMDKDGKLFPCKYLKEKSLHSFNIQSDQNLPTGFPKCYNCNFRHFCGGLCQAIQQNANFEKICKFQKKRILNIFSNLRLDVFSEKNFKKARNLSQEEIIPEEQRKKEIENLEKQLQRRHTCQIGVF